MKIRLNKNEMPYPPPKTIRDAVKQSIDDINRYTPQEKVEELTSLISEYNNIDQNSIYLNFGSDSILKEFIFLFSKNRTIIYPDPSFFLINNSAVKTSSKILKVKIAPPDFKFPVSYIERKINEPILIILDNPNNPTGKLIVSKDEIVNLLNLNQVTMLIDEAYYEFSQYSVIDLIKNYPNLAISRTLSKTYGLAGSGIGYLIMGDIIKKKFEGLEVMMPFPSVIAAIESLKNREYVKEYVDNINKEKKRVLETIENLGLMGYSSKTNFLLIKSNHFNIAQELFKRNLIVNNVSNYFSSNYFRVTISNKDENDKFLKALQDIVA